MATPGMLLAHRYRLDAPLASGRSGDVWRAFDLLLDRPVAIKVLHGNLGSTEHAGRFRREARAVATLEHPGIAHLFNYVDATADHPACLIMQHVEGDTLDRRVATAGPLQPEQAATIVAQAAGALQAMHQAGIVHRELTPAHLVLRPDGTVVLVDVGLAHADQAPGSPAAAPPAGDLPYLAPELIHGGSPTVATDVYALGAVAYLCLTGHPPQVHTGTAHANPPPLPAHLPGVVRRLVGRAMSTDPVDRFPTAAALAVGAAVAATVRPGRAFAARVSHGSAGLIGGAGRAISAVIRTAAPVPAGTHPVLGRVRPAAVPAAVLAVCAAAIGTIALGQPDGTPAGRGLGTSAAPWQPDPAPAEAVVPAEQGPAGGSRAVPGPGDHRDAAGVDGEGFDLVLERGDEGVPAATPVGGRTGAPGDGFPHPTPAPPASPPAPTEPAPTPGPTSPAPSPSDPPTDPPSDPPTDPPTDPPSDPPTGSPSDSPATPTPDPSAETTADPDPGGPVQDPDPAQDPDDPAASGPT